MISCGSCNAVRGYDKDSDEVFNRRVAKSACIGFCIMKCQAVELSSFCQDWHKIHMDVWERYYTKGIALPKRAKKIFQFGLMKASEQQEVLIDG